MHKMGISWYYFAFLWRNFHISSIDLSAVEEKQDDCYVGVNEELEENTLAGYPIDRHNHKSPNFEETDTDTRTNQPQDIIKNKK